MHLRGTVEFDNDDWMELQQFVENLATRLFKITNPDTGETCLVSFAENDSGNPTPHSDKQTIIVGRSHMYFVSIALAIEPNSKAFLVGMR